MHRFALPLAALVAVPALAACGTQSASDAAGAVTVTSADDACTLSRLEAPAGSVTFQITNTGSKPTEFYLYKADGTSIVGEVENIGPELGSKLVVAVPEGSYVTACKPGMTGDGIRGTFTVTPSDVKVSAAAAAPLRNAEEQYAEYVRRNAADLLIRTKGFAAAYSAGRDSEARRLYPHARAPFERIEPVAESFGDLDALLDAREADLEQGQTWSGWHYIEKDLWPQRATGYTPLTSQQRHAAAAELVSLTQRLVRRASALTFTAAEIANGTRALMEEVANGKVTGEEEYWSRTDLADFAANLEGAHEGFELLEPAITITRPELVAELHQGFEAVQALLAQHRTGGSFVAYDELAAVQVKELADSVNALSEPLSELTAAVAG